MKLPGGAFPLRECVTTGTGVVVLDGPTRAASQTNSWSEQYVAVIAVHASGRRSLPPAVTAPNGRSREPGRERPSLWTPDFAPGRIERGSLTPRLPFAAVVVSTLDQAIVDNIRARHQSVIWRDRTDARIVPEARALRFLAVRARRPSRDRVSSCARRRARLVASLRPRAWSARGLRALTAPALSSGDRNYVMAATNEAKQLAWRCCAGYRRDRHDGRSARSGRRGHFRRRRCKELAGRGVHRSNRAQRPRLTQSPLALLTVDRWAHSL